MSEAVAKAARPGPEDQMYLAIAKLAERLTVLVDLVIEQEGEG